MKALTSVLIFSIISVNEACRGSKAFSTLIANCKNDGKDVLRIKPNSSIYVNEKCELISNICADYDGFKTATSRITTRKGTNLVFNQTIDSCAGGKGDVRISIKIISGFPYWDCTSRPGNYCHKNKKMTVLNPASMKFIELVELGTVRVQYSTTFDGGRHSCVYVDMTVQKY